MTHHLVPDSSGEPREAHAESDTQRTIRKLGEWQAAIADIRRIMTNPATHAATGEVL